jgi:hypothetical protein
MDMLGYNDCAGGEWLDAASQRYASVSQDTGRTKQTEGYNGTHTSIVEKSSHVRQGQNVASLLVSINQLLDFRL